MIHPKMKYTYVGIDSHKDTHTAVFIDCFFEKLGVITFDNRPDAFNHFLSGSEKYKMDGTVFLFGLEDVSVYGRSLAAFLKNNGQAVKHTNAYLVAWQRKNQLFAQKSDEVDAECAARVLLSNLNKLPDANPKDDYSMLRTLVSRRNSIVHNNGALKNSLHDLLTRHYPGYTKYFANIDSKTSLAFYMRYPSPSALHGTTAEELAVFIKHHSNNKLGLDKAVQILDSLYDTAEQYQEIRNFTVQSVIRQLQFNFNEMAQLESAMAKMLTVLKCPLTSMNGIDVVSASQILSCIGDITRFPTAAKLARYAGIAPISYASGKTDKQYTNQRGKRELNSLFYNLALRVSVLLPKTKIINPFFNDYYQRKISEGKTKTQALKCVQRRLVNIIWTMLTNNEDYVNPPMGIHLPEKTKK